MAVPQPLATAGDTSGYQSLPVNPDEGFPQSFLLGFGDQTYVVAWYVNVAEDMFGRPLDPRTTIDLSGTATTSPRASLVLSIARRDPAQDVMLLRRRVHAGLVYVAGQLSIAIDTVSIAVGNLNGVGSFGSVLAARVAAR